MHDPIRRLMLAALAAALVVSVAVPARSAWDQPTLQGRLQVASPAGASVEVVSSPTGPLFAALARYQGPALPAEKSIVIRFDPPTAPRFQAFYFLGPVPGQIQTTPAWIDSLTKAPNKTQFVIWREPSGEWGCLIGLVGGGMRTYLQGDGKSVLAYADSLDSHHSPTTSVPMFAIGWGPDPYKLIDAIYDYGFKVMRATDPKSVAGRRRAEKKFPEIWKYLGWCSWNTYYRTVSAGNLYSHAARFQAAGVPVRWMLIDDGWNTINHQFRNNFIPLQQGVYMTGFDADPLKYPGGLRQTTRTLKEKYGITWVGVWHTFNGYWDNIQLDSEAGRACQDCLLPVTAKTGVPDPRSDAGARWWDAWYQHLKDAGIDFVKVDNQEALPHHTREKVPVVYASAQSHRNWEAAAEKYFGSNAMNCQEQDIATIYQWNTTNVGRAAYDYTPYVYNNPRINVFQNVMNSLWFTQVLEPDYDMWMSHDWHAEYNAVAHAISGGPVYTTDQLGMERFGLYWRLIYADGLVIRPDQPALPVRKFLFSDPRTDLVPLVAFAPTGDAGLLAAWNVDRAYRTIPAELSPSDVEGIDGDRFAVYEFFSGEIRVLGREEKFPVSLDKWGVKIWSVVPVRNGFAAIGLTGKYACAATVARVEHAGGRVNVTLNDAGTFVAWSDARPKTIALDGTPVPERDVDWSRNVLKVRVPGQSGKRQAPRLEFGW